MKQPTSTLEASFADLFRFIKRKECGLVYLPEKRWFGIQVRGKRGPLQKIDYCPFTGKRLPPDLWDAFFDELEKLDISSDAKRSLIPVEYKTERWWLKRGL